MTSSPRLPLPELITEYTLHSDRRHLFVEGQLDQAVLKWYLEPHVDIDNKLYVIDSVEITAEKLGEHGLTEGQKNRLICLARELDAHLPKDVNPVLCVVDADFDYLLDSLVETRFLSYTDGTSLEMYAFTASGLERVIRLGLRNTIESSSGIIQSLFGVLKDIFIIRAANESLQLGLEWLPFERRCRIRPDGTVQFDKDRFIRDYLGKNGVLDKLDEFVGCVSELETRELDVESRWIRGHDFGKLLSKYLRSTITSKVTRKTIQLDVIDRMLFVALDRKQLEGEPLFQRIEEFFGH